MSREGTREDRLHRLRMEQLERKRIREAEKQRRELHLQRIRLEEHLREMEGLERRRVRDLECYWTRAVERALGEGDPEGSPDVRAWSPIPPEPKVQWYESDYVALLIPFLLVVAILFYKAIAS